VSKNTDKHFALRLHLASDLLAEEKTFTVNYRGLTIMKRKTIYSLLVTMILMGSQIPLQTQAISDVIEWHSSLTDGTVVAWRIIDQYLFDPAVPPSLGNEKINLGSVFAFEINDTLPTNYDDVYSTGLPPDFLKLFVDYKEVSLFDTDDQTEPSFALQYLILPYLFYPVSGETYNITQLLEHRATLDPNTTSISYTITGGNYVRVSIYNDFIDSFIITINNQTGIVADFFIEDDFGEMYGQLDIWESSLDDSATPITNTMNWHPNLEEGTILSWQVTELTFDPTHEGYIVMAEQNMTVGGIFKFEFPNPFPTDPWNYYNPDSYFNVFYEEEPVRWENITRAQLEIWSTMINPLSVTLYNATMVYMEAIHYLRDFMNPSISGTSTSHSESHNYLTCAYAEGDIDYWSSYEINAISGIVQTLNVVIPDFVDFEMVFVPAQSSLLNDGSVNPDYPPDNNTTTLPGFNWFCLFFAALILIPILRKRK